MGKTINFVIILQAALLSILGCSDFELHVKKETYGLKPAMILIGSFDIWNMNYDPYVSEEFREAVQYEFFRRGYSAVLISKSEADIIKESARASKICADNDGDILVKGFISQRESGFLEDREISTSISFKVYGKNGAVLGEGFYHDNKSAGEESFRRVAADKFVSALLNNIGRAE